MRKRHLRASAGSANIDIAGGGIAPIEAHRRPESPGLAGSVSGQMRSAHLVCVGGALAALACIVVHAQGGPPMITDDPGTPGDGHWEINVATLATRSVDGDSYQLPLIDLNYGWGDRIQLKYEVPWVLERDAGNSIAGLGNSLLGIKWRFYDAGPSGWQVSTYPQAQFNYPTSGSPRRGLAVGGTTYLLPAEFERSYENFDVNFEFGRWIRPAPLADSWVVGAVIGHEVLKGFEVIAEVHNEMAAGSRRETIVNFGSRWDFSDRYTLLISAGRDVQNTLGPTNTLITYLGLQMRL